MSDKKDKKNVRYCFIPVPLIPMWGFPGKKDDDEYEEDWETFKSNLKTFWEQMRDMQKSTIDANKEQWDIFFDYTSKMQDAFIDSLPDEAPEGIPEPPVSPKEYLKKQKEVREMVKDRATEQADSLLDFAKKSQEHVKETVTDGVKNIEDEFKKDKDSDKPKAEPEKKKKKVAPKE